MEKKKGLMVIGGMTVVVALSVLLMVSCSQVASTSSGSLKVTNISPYALGSGSSSSSGVKVSALPSDLKLNVTFDNMSVSSDGSTWQVLFNTPTTINLLDTAAQSMTGTSVSITSPPAGTYSYLKMGVSAVYFSQTGQPDRDILPILKLQSGGQEDWHNMMMPILPFTYSGSEQLGLNIFMPPSNVSGSTYSTYFPENGPVFTFTGGSVASTGIGTLNLSIASGVTAGNTAHAGAFRSIEKDAGPTYAASLTNAGDGSASGTLQVPAGSWYVMAVEVEGAMGVNGPGEGSRIYTAAGALPWQNLSPTTVATDDSTAVSLEFAFTITSTMGGGGAGTPPSGNGEIAFTLQASPSAVTLPEDAELMLYAFSSLSDLQSGNPPAYFLGSQTVSAGAFSSANVTASGLGAGNYVVVAMLKLGEEGPPTANVDYIGAYGGFASPTVITLAEGETQDLTGSPIYLSLY